MKFEVQFSDRAVRDLHALPTGVQARVIRKLHDAAEDPARFFRRLAGARAFRLRVGDYRVLADIDSGRRIIQVAHIAHRRNVYD